ncbi:MAG: hypothetical protein ACSLE0_21605 [Chitinophagaceae bacterium]
MKLKLYSFLFFIGVMFFSCKTAGKLYQAGQYDEAVAMAAKKLSKKPNDESTLNLLTNAYRYAVEDHESRIRNLSNSTSDLRWENIYHEYISLQNLYTAIRRSPSVFAIVKPADYSSYITTYKEEAGNARFERGLELLDENNKQSSRAAYYEFQKALALRPGDLSIKRKLDEAYTNAATNIIVLPLTRYGYQYGSYNFDYQNFNYNLVRYLKNNNRNSFARFQTQNDLDNGEIRPDNFVEMRFSDVNIGQYRDQRNTREVSKQVVAKEIVINKDSVIKEYITVKAKITTTTRVILANGLLQATIRDGNERRLWSDTYRGEYSWSASFATYTGDERALSEDDKRLISQIEQWPPSNDEIIRIIMEDIRRKTECGISDYFNLRN